MVLKKCLRISLLTLFLLAGCVQPTPTPTATVLPPATNPNGAGTAYPGEAPTDTPGPSSYPAPGDTPVPPEATALPATPYPVATAGG